MDLAHEVAQTYFDYCRDILDVRSFADWLDVQTFYAGRQTRNCQTFLQSCWPANGARAGAPDKTSSTAGRTAP